MIKAQELTRKYGDFTAVKDASFSIDKGEIVGLLGHNGAGKTTIMKILTGFLEATSGQVEIDGLSIENNRLAIQQKIGYLPENCPLYPEMTIIDYLYYVAALRNIPEEQRASAIRDVIEKTELGSKARDPISTLSRGYKQRVGVAQAIIHNPEILILDEPTNGLDPSQIEEMRGLIRKLSEHSTIILSTHILQEVQAICNRVIIIRQGEVALDSKIDDLQSSNRLLLTVSEAEDAAKSKLKNCHGVRSINLHESHGKLNTFVLEIEKNGSDPTPDIAKTAVESGMQLFSLQNERRDLESVFREINSGKRG